MSIAINNIPVLAAKLHLPRYGQWVCEATLDDPDDGSFDALLDSGIATMTADTSAFAVSDAVVGRIDAQQAGSFALLGAVVFTAGKGTSLTDEIAERAYHDESGVRISTVLDDICADTGHLRGDATTARLPGKHFLRERGPASRALTAALGKQWTFDLAGKLYTRLANTSFPEFDLLDYSAVNQRCTLALNNLKDPRGCTIPELGKVVTSATITVDRAGMRAECELGEASLTTLIESIVESVIARKVLAPAYYRVHSMASGGRVNLQPYDAAAGLPDLINVSQYPGIAGAVVTLNPGQTVLVQWVGNDRTKPIITQHVSEGDEHISASITINGSNAVAARVGDPVSVSPLPGQIITITTPTGTPIASGVFAFSMTTPIPGLDPTKLHGEITSSTSTVRL